MNSRGYSAVILIIVTSVAVVLGGLAVVEPWSTKYPDEKRLHVDRVNNTGEISGGVVEYETLSPDQKQVFEDAVADEDGSASIPERIDPEVWLEQRTVRYGNETYTTNVLVY